MDNKIVNLELKMINVEKTVQMVEQDTRVRRRVQGSLIKPNLAVITFQNKSLEIEVMERDMKDQLTDDINEIRVEFLQNWEKFMRRQNEMQADFDFLNNAMNEGKFEPWYIFKQPHKIDKLGASMIFAPVKHLKKLSRDRYARVLTNRISPRNL